MSVSESRAQREVLDKLTKHHKVKDMTETKKLKVKDVPSGRF